MNIAVKIRPFGKAVETRNIAVKVPETCNEPAMVVVVAGGTLSPLFKSLLAPFPTMEEGTAGYIRWLTENNAASNSLVSLQVMPTPSYGYQGKLLEDLPVSVVELLRYSDGGGGSDHADLAESGRLCG